jgi:post-segregation antitoxin (ccd killing protein)
MNAVSLTIDKTTADGLQQAADELGVNMTDLAEKAIQRFLRQQAERKIDKEEALYHAQFSRLAAQYNGRYIALHHGEVVDSDENELNLYLRVRRAYPMIGVLIKKVTENPEIIWQMRSPRLEYD